ncbi:hypothetical protein [Brucella intermedia]|uniref:hypothetical protein n=1 Tax=Brucella intermedia TaxID=94625 RepID=UPI00124C2AA9|nr:hypothetical protein [Brucella intermedia]KAB2716967.1 hypothetical protein F9K75_12925 [Brucella intermedia]
MKSFSVSKRSRKAILLGLAGGVLAVLVIEILLMFQRDGVCSLDDKTGTVCFREWIGALSGWAGAVAAAFTLIVLFQQIKDQRKQTAYAIGEAEPDFLIERRSHESRCTLKVVNFSRHNIVVDEINILSPTAIKITKMIVERQPLSIAEPRVLIKGNINRKASPPIREIVVEVGDILLGNSVNIMDHPLELEISYRKIGQNHTRHSTTASALNKFTV